MSLYLPIGPKRKKIVNEFRPAFEKEGALKVGQNIKYDMLVLGNYGTEVRGPLFDTMVAHYVLQPELRTIWTTLPKSTCIIRLSTSKN